MYNFSSKNERKRPLGSHRRRMEDNIKVDPNGSIISGYGTELSGPGSGLTLSYYEHR
jgi:hypothetical protein